MGIIDDLKKEAEAAVKEHEEYRSKKAEESDRPALRFIGEGNTKLRLYLDKEGKLFRSLNRFNINGVKIQDTGEGGCKEIHSMIEELRSLGDGNAWRLFSAEHVLCYATILSQSKSDDFTLLDTPLVLVIKPKIYFGFMKCFNEWKSDFLTKMLDPTVEANAFTIDFEFGRDGSANVNADVQLITKVDPLPDKFPPLSEVWYKVGDQPSAEDVNKIKEYLAGRINAYKNTKAPTENRVDSSAPAQPSQMTCPHEADGMKFGSIQDNDPRCMLCDRESLCRASKK